MFDKLEKAMKCNSINHQNYFSTFAFIMFVMSGSCLAGNSISGNKNIDINDNNGPTVLLSYKTESSQTNPFGSFMYFTPLLSTVAIDIETSADNNQITGLVSFEKKMSSKSFTITCEFEMAGKGYYKYIFDPDEIIAEHLKVTKKGQTLSHLIDYIKFDGLGLGEIVVKGTITNSIPTVTEVDQKFNAEGRKSPVILGLYDVKPKDGQYKYENRSGELVARVDTFIFKKTEGQSRMGIKLASVSPAAKPNGFLDGFIGSLANLFLEPPTVSSLGNDTMLNFGTALLNEKPAFTFPRAIKIRQTKTEPNNFNQ
jgi:hypothetical protein